ncbi:MAG: hypothetical protein WCI51_05745 [Lentisphaerota bacterium]
MEMLTGFLSWFFILAFKVLLLVMLIAAVVWILLILVCYLFGRGVDYLQDKIDSFNEKPPANNDPAPVPPAATGTACGNQTWITGKDDYGVNMEGMNGYPGGYGDEQMFEDEEEFQGMDYGLLDDEAKDENKEL